jgi:hypothetical protein
MNEAETLQTHWDIVKLLSLGVSEKFIRDSIMKPSQARDFVKGPHYRRECYGDAKE